MFVSASSTQHAFAVIVGGGMAGSSCAYHLTQRNIKVRVWNGEGAGRIVLKGWGEADCEPTISLREILRYGGETGKGRVTELWNDKSEGGGA